MYARVLTGPEQVGVLERGDVVIQYSPSVVEERQLTSLLDGDVVLAPGIQLGDAVVATAWGKRISCRSADDLGSIEDFVVDAKDGGPGAH